MSQYEDQKDIYEIGESPQSGMLTSSPSAAPHMVFFWSSLNRCTLDLVCSNSAEVPLQFLVLVSDIIF